MEIQEFWIDDLPFSDAIESAPVIASLSKPDTDSPIKVKIINEEFNKIRAESFKRLANDYADSQLRLIQVEKALKDLREAINEILSTS